MLPWNFGFHWTLGTATFLGALYTVFVVVATTYIASTVRSRRALREGHTGDPQWPSDFLDLPGRDRVCRHQLTGDVDHRECTNGFDCRECETHRIYLELRKPQEPGATSFAGFGMTFPLDRLYHRGHTWVRREKNGTVTIGLDDLGRRLVGLPDSVELPRKGERLRLHWTAWRMKKRGVDLRVVSPVAGVVVETGGPDKDWYLKVRPEQSDLRHLIEGLEVQPWVANEMERIQIALSAWGLAPVPAEARTDVTPIIADCPTPCWEAVCGAMFLRP